MQPNHNFLPRSISACPAAGAGVHGWILAAANRCRAAGLSAADAERLISERMTRPPQPANEIRVAVAKAFGETNWESPTVQLTWRSSAANAPVPLTEIEFDLAKLAEFAARINTPASWRHWLWERSPKRPETQNSFSFLAHLYRAGEIVLTFEQMESKHPLHPVNISAPMDCRVSPQIRNGGHSGQGIWFLCNPVDGQWHETGESDEFGKAKFSCRNHQAITSWRYAVLESDRAPADLWLAFIAQLPIRIAAIYTSGSRSIHALVQIDANSKAEWDATISPLKRPLKVLGADPACLSAVRLTRLPQCRRPEKKGVQKLLYLCPNPPLAPLVDLPVLFSRADTLARWQNIYPRWNSEAEAFR